MEPMIGRWWPDLAAGLAVLLAGAVETQLNGAFAGGVPTAVPLTVLATAAAVAVVRRAPWLGLTLAGLTFAVQLYASVTGRLAPVLLTQAFVLVVVFGVARWGSPATLVAGAASLPVGAFLTVAYLARPVAAALSAVVDVRPLLAKASLITGQRQLGATVLALFVLGGPLLLGLLARVSAQAREQQAEAAVGLARAEARRQQAREMAEVREQQAQLARDVHDVVGHSLAVILAQAESGRYLPDDDPAALKATLATVATSARSSLQDVRRVLAATRDDPAPGDMDRLIEGLRTAGHRVESTCAGDPVPLTPPEAATAYRILQEMLTNALRHGRRDGPIVVRRTWAPQSLTVEVSNPAAPGSASSDPGRGLTGMRERLRALGGQLTSGRDGDTFVVTATIPLAAAG
jgi:signal transduction histidine kinase